MQKLVTDVPIERIKEEEIQPIPLKQMKQVLLMPFVGVILSALIYAVEITPNKFLNKMNKKRLFIRRSFKINIGRLSSFKICEMFHFYCTEKITQAVQRLFDNIEDISLKLIRLIRKIIRKI